MPPISPMVFSGGLLATDSTSLQGLHGDHTADWGKVASGGYLGNRETRGVDVTQHRDKGSVLIALAIAVALATVFGPGCSRSGDTGDTTGGDTSLVPRERDDDGVRMLSVDGRDITMASVPGALADGWPGELPTPAGADVRYSESIESEGSDGIAYRAEFESSQPFDEVVASYVAALRDAGWVIDEEASAGETGSRNAGVSASRTDGALGAVVTELEDGVSVFLEAGILTTGGE